MRRRPLVTWLVLSLSLVVGGAVAFAHITPPVVLISDRDAVLGMTTGAKSSSYER